MELQWYFMKIMVLWKYFGMDDIWDNENKYGTIINSENIEYNWCYQWFIEYIN